MHALTHPRTHRIERKRVGAQRAGEIGAGEFFFTRTGKPKSPLRLHVWEKAQEIFFVLYKIALSALAGEVRLHHPPFFSLDICPSQGRRAAGNCLVGVRGAMFPQTPRRIGKFCRG